MAHCSPSWLGLTQDIGIPASRRRRPERSVAGGSTERQGSDGGSQLLVLDLVNDPLLASTTYKILSALGTDNK